MRFAILYSKKDEAGISIANQLSRHFLPQAQIIELSKDSIYSENIDEKLPELRNADFIIFATKHKSEKGDKSLSVHAPGNWRNADFGGKPGKICKTSPQAIKFLFQKLSENAASANLSDYQITLECTHHGPLLESKPCCFIELGSSEAQWKDEKAAAVLAKTIADFQNFIPNSNIKSAIGIGGPHYCPNFNKIQLSKESNIAIGHVIPEYALPLTESLLKEAVEKTADHLDLLLLDWKGCGKSEERQKLIELLDKAGLKHERAERIKK